MLRSGLEVVLDLVWLIHIRGEVKSRFDLKVVEPLSLESGPVSGGGGLY